MFRALALISLAFPLAIATSAAVAQSKHDSDAPIDVSSEHMELLDRQNRALLTGAVHITQAEMTLDAATVTVTYTGQVSDGSPQISRLDAAGGVTLRRPDQHAQSQYAVYDLNRRVITMIGAVTLTQGTNVVHGERLLYNLDTGRATVDGSGVGASGVPGATSQSGRVTGRFSVPKRDTQPQPQPQPQPTPQQ